MHVRRHSKHTLTAFIPAKRSLASLLVSSGKEYTQADSRYATRDSFVISMEAVTAFVEGPACFLAVYGILARRPWAYTVQIMVSLGQIYGDVLYFATTVLEGALTAALQRCVCNHCCSGANAGCCFNALYSSHACRCCQ